MKTRGFLSILALLAIIFPTALVAAGKARKSKPTKEAVAEPASAPSIPGRLRLWKPALAHHGDLQLVWKSAANAKSPTELRGGASGNQFVDDAAVPAGPGSLFVFDKSFGKEPIASLDGTIAPGPCAIAVITETSDGKNLKMEWVRVGTPASADAELIVFNVVPELRSCRVAIGSGLILPFTSAGAYARLRGIKRAFVAISVEGDDTKGKPFKWVSDVDFAKVPRAIVLIRLDNYARIRPELMIENDEPLVDAAAKD